MFVAIIPSSVNSGLPGELVIAPCGAIDVSYVAIFHCRDVHFIMIVLLGWASLFTVMMNEARLFSVK